MVDGSPALYSALDVVVLTSRNEGTPVALIGVGAAGRPAVATRVGGVADVVRDGETISWYPRGTLARSPTPSRRYSTTRIERETSERPPGEM